MAQYRKKPVVIEAWPVRGLLHAATESWDMLPQPVIEAYENSVLLFHPGGVSVRTQEGVMRAAPDDMLIRGVKGEFYPCKPDIFEATYEPA